MDTSTHRSFNDIGVPDDIRIMQGQRVLDWVHHTIQRSMSRLSDSNCLDQRLLTAYPVATSRT